MAVQLSEWMPAIVAIIGGLVALVGVAWQISERRDARAAAAIAEEKRLAAEEERKRAEEKRQAAELDKEVAIEEHRATVAALEAQKDHLQLFMADNQRLREIVRNCEGDCDALRRKYNDVLDEVAVLRRELHDRPGG